MKIRKIAAMISAAALTLALAGCGNDPDFDELFANNGGAGTNSNGSSTGKVFGIEDDVPDPPKQVSMWDVLPEIPVTDASAFTYKYDSELGGMVVTDYLRESPKVRIPDTLEGEPVVKVDFSGVKKEITELVMPDSIREFKTTWYANIKNTLQYVNVPRGITTIGSNNIREDGNFAEYKNLIGVFIPDSVSDIGSFAFEKCTSLTSITIPDSVTKIGGAFRDCSSLTSITIPDSVTHIDGDNYGGGAAFSGCTSLTNATYKGKTYDYEHIGALYDAINMDESGMYIVNSELRNVSRDLSEFVVPNSVTKIGGYAFGDCTSLTSITIPDSVTEIGGGAFSGCTSLTSITIPNSVTKIGSSAFNGCTSLTTINVADGNSNYFSIDGMLCEKSDNGGVVIDVCPGGKEGSLVIPDSVTEIRGGAFERCTSLTSITIPDSVTSIGEGAFENCISLASIKIPNSLTEVASDTFNGCKALTEITIPDSVTAIGTAAFKGCASLTSITIPDSVNSIAIYDGSGMITSTPFDGCQKNIEVIYKGKTYSINTSIYSIRALDDAINCGESGMIIRGNYLVRVSREITEVVIPDNITEISKNAFDGCANLKSITFKGVTYNNEDDFLHAFVYGY